MAGRAIASGTISFGLVSIPVKLFTAAASEQVRFNMLSPETGSRVKQQYIDATNGKVVARSALVRGYEYAKGQFVTFTEEEHKALETARSNAFDILEFVPLESVDLVQVEKSYYLGADKGGDKAYRLLNVAMKNTQRVAVGRWTARGKEQLVLIRPYRRGLILHQMFYANEVRAFDEIDDAATFEFRDVELDLAAKLIDELTVPKFAPEKYKDDYALRVEAAVEQKVAGKEITIAPEQPKAQIIDLFEALKKSLAELGAGADDAPSEERQEEPSLKAKPVQKAAPRKSKRKTGT